MRDVCAVQPPSGGIGSPAVGGRVFHLRVEESGPVPGLDSTDALAKNLKAFAGKLDSLHKTLVATKEGGILVGEEQLRERVVDLYGAINGYGGKPTKSQIERMDAVSKELANSEKTFEQFVKTDLEAFNAQLTAKKLPVITVITRAEFDKKD